MTTLRSIAESFQSSKTSVITMSAATAALSVALLACSVIFGGTHFAFQFVRPIDEYGALLVSRGPQLRIELALDYAFLGAYTALFVLIGDATRKWNGEIARLPVWLAILLGSSVVDIVENAHILAMLSIAEKGLAVSQLEVTLQAVIGHCKFMLNILGFLVLSFALPRQTTIEKVLVCYLRWIQVPLGAAVLVMPLTLARPFLVVRLIGFIAAIFAFAFIARNRAD